MYMPVVFASMLVSVYTSQYTVAAVWDPMATPKGKCFPPILTMERKKPIRRFGSNVGISWRPLALSCALFSDLTPWVSAAVFLGHGAPRGYFSNRSLVRSAIAPASAIIPNPFSFPLLSKQTHFSCCLARVRTHVANVCIRSAFTLTWIYQGEEYVFNTYIHIVPCL